MDDIIEPRPGRVKCLRCDKFFNSRDIATNRICATCTRLLNREYIPRIFSTALKDTEKLSNDLG